MFSNSLRYNYILVKVSHSGRGLGQIKHSAAPRALLALDGLVSFRLLKINVCHFAYSTNQACMATSLYQGLKENEQGVNCTYLYQEKPLRSGFKEYLPVPVSTRDTHNHSVDAAELGSTENHSHTKTQGSRESIQPIPTLYLNEVHQVAGRPDMDEVAAKLPTFQSMRASLYRTRRKRLPLMPNTRAEVHFEDEWTRQQMAGDS